MVSQTIKTEHQKQFLLQYIKIGMDCLQSTIKSRRNLPLVLSVLNYPSTNYLKQVPSPSNQFSLYNHIQKKITLASQKTSIQRSKLLTNLQIYQWRCHTQFPIVKTIFVQLKQNQNQSPQLVEVITYNQYCPLKITQLSQLPLNQILYVLKESLLGFERLFTKFGPFQIVNSMIAINERGYCRVWLNQNFSINYPLKRETNQKNMVNKIINIIQSYSQQSKATKKLFAWLRNYKTFLQLFRAVQQYIKKTKTFVPTKLINQVINKQAKKNKINQVSRNFGSSDMIPSARLSIKLEAKNKLLQSISDQIKQGMKNRKVSFSPLIIKRFKSQNSMKIIQVQREKLKTSGQQTTYTGRVNKSSNVSANLGLKKELNTPEKYTIDSLDSPAADKKKRVAWIEESNFIMGQQPINPQKSQKKKDLSQSEFNPIQNTTNNHMQRKYSCRVSPQKTLNSLAKNLYSIKKSINQPYYSEFEELLNDNKNQQYNTKAIEEEDEQKFRQQMSGNVLRNNGWVPKVSGLLNVQTRLEQSFHEDKQQYRNNKAIIKLQKLQKLGKNEMIMSFLNQQIGELL